jgi:dihydroneopterin aldolase
MLSGVDLADNGVLAGWPYAIRHSIGIRGAMKASIDKLDGDRLIIEKLRLPARVGVYPDEKARTQTICLSLEIGLRNQDCYVSDELEDTICYMAVTQAMRDLAISRHFNLIETLAEKIAHKMLSHGASWVTVRVGKVGIVPGAEAVDIAITRRLPQTRGQAAAPVDIATSAH